MPNNFLHVTGMISAAFDWILTIIIKMSNTQLELKLTPSKLQEEIPRKCLLTITITAYSIAK